MYNSLLWKNTGSNKWEGQMQAYQLKGSGANLNFIGGDLCLYPGGPAIYNMAYTDSLCEGALSRVFCQANSAVLVRLDWQI